VEYDTKILITLGRSAAKHQPDIDLLLAHVILLRSYQMG